MRCLHCGKRLSLLRKLQDAEFCSDEHKLAFQQQQSDLALSRLMDSQKRIDRPQAPAAKTLQQARKAVVAPAPETPPADPPFGPSVRFGFAPKNTRPCLHGVPEPIAIPHFCTNPSPEPCLGRPRAATRLLRLPLSPLAAALRARLRIGERIAARRLIHAPRLHLAQNAPAPRPAPCLPIGVQYAPGGPSLHVIDALPLAEASACAPVATSGARCAPVVTRLSGLFGLTVTAQTSAAPDFGPLLCTPQWAPVKPEIPADPGHPADWPFPAQPDPAREPLLAEKLFRLPVRSLPGQSLGVRPIPLDHARRTARVIAWPVRSAPLCRQQLATANRLAALHWKALRPAAGLESWSCLPLRICSPAGFPATVVRAVHDLPSAGLQPFASGPEASAASGLRPLNSAPLGSEGGGPLVVQPDFPVREPGIPASRRLAALGAPAPASGPPHPASPFPPTPTAACAPELPILTASSPAEPPALQPSGDLAGLPPVAAVPWPTLSGTETTQPSAPAIQAVKLPLSSGVRHEGSEAFPPPDLEPATAPLPRWLRPEPRQWRSADSPPKPSATPVSRLTGLPGSSAAGDVAPPLCQRLIPLRAGRSSAPDFEPLTAALQSYWPEPDAIVAYPRCRLRTDRPDGSGPRLERLPPPGQGFRLPGFPGALRFWRHAPADLKWISVGMPLVLLLILYSALPSNPAPRSEPGADGRPSTSAGVRSSVATRMSGIQSAIMRRAAINLTDDFRSGLGNWDGPGEWAKSWTYDQAGFVIPGTIALYSPTLPLADYSLEFLGQVERRSLNWAIRARDPGNYYAMRLVLTSQGPMPKASIVRYAVIDGKEGPPTTLPLPMALNPNMLFRIRVEAKGSTFITWMSGQVIDNFTDNRLARGGIGFFSPKGDKSRLRWVEVSHQYDFLGRLCALLAPYSVQAEGREAE